MAQYMTPMNLPVRSWENNGTWTNGSVTSYATPRWGDSDGKHIPWAAFIPAYVAQQHLTGPAAASVSATMLSHHLISSQTGRGRRSTTTSRPSTTPAPASRVFITLTPTTTMPNSTTKTTTTKRDTHHTPAPAYFAFDAAGTPISSTMLTPQNPATDTADAAGWNDTEKLWLFQNRDDKNGRAECYDYHSCYDHCRHVRKKESKARVIALSTLGGVAGLAALLAALRQLLKPKAPPPPPPLPPPPPPPVDGSGFDGAVDMATTGTGAAWVPRPMVVDRRSRAVATGSDGFHEVEIENVVVRRGGVTTGSEGFHDAEEVVARRV